VQRDWKEILFNRRMLVCLFIGFTSGMPLYVLIQLVPAWLRSHGIDLATIGLFSLVSLPYTWKFLWSPLMDRFSWPFLGRRRGWALVTQVLLFYPSAHWATLIPDPSSIVGSLCGYHCCASRTSHRCLPA
jgi:PAT family beta-lactamase induction signal transducer AmpG